MAKLAQLPPVVIGRAQEILMQLLAAQEKEPSAFVPATHDQQIIGLKKELAVATDFIEQFLAIDYDQLSPKKAFDFLWTCKDQLTKK